MDLERRFHVLFGLHPLNLPGCYEKTYVGGQTVQPVSPLKFESNALRVRVYNITVTPIGTVWRGQISEQNVSRKGNEMSVREAQKLEVAFITKLLV
jgi:hypothetical protein